VSRKRTSGSKAQVVSLLESAPDGSSLSDIVGKALGYQTRPANSKTLGELRMEWGVSRSVMQKTLKKLIDDGMVTRLKIVERDETGKAKQNTVYLKVGA
jgi:DNA-binding MarR family transcriptional regulator